MRASSQHVHDSIPAEGAWNKACVVAVELHNERAHFISAEDIQGERWMTFEGCEGLGGRGEVDDV